VDDEQVFAALYPRLRRLAAVVGPPGVAPDDLVQEALTRRLAIGPLGDLHDPGAYLGRAVVNLARNGRRSWRRGVVAQQRSGRPADVDDTYPSDLADLARLTPHQRGALYLHYVEGWSFAEVGGHLGCSEEAARQAASRGRQLLAVMLRQEERA
jgi:DNA-directed RNA polymerase specialized sigma24 family protein